MTTAVQTVLSVQSSTWYVIYYVVGMYVPGMYVISMYVCIHTEYLLNCT